MEPLPRTNASGAHDHAEDCALVDRVRAGDPTAFELLAKKYRRPLAGYFRNRNATDPERVDELVQRTWIQFTNTVRRGVEEGGWDPEAGSLYTWLIGYHARYILLRWRRERHHEANRTISLDEVDSPRRAETLLVGDDPDPAAELMEAEDTRMRRRAAQQLFCLAALCGGYPHQFLAYGFAKLIYGIDTKRGIQGNAKRVANDHGPTALSRLGGEFWDTFVEHSDLGRDELAPMQRVYTLAMDHRLPMTVDKLFERDAHAYRTYRPEAASRIDDTSMETFYSALRGGYTAAIPDWCNRLENRVRTLLGLGATDPEALDPPVAGCRRCKMLEACPVMSPAQLPVS